MPSGGERRGSAGSTIEGCVERVKNVKPASDPLQFVKVGPCHLYRSAQEQLRKAEEVKKFTAKELRRDDQEDWQSNLDNWKSSRRKQVEHIIERCVEVKKMESEETDRSKRRSKTFNEMIEDRAFRRNARAPLPIYCEEDNNDLSDLGIGTSSASGKSSLSEDCDNHSLASDGMDLEKNQSDVENMFSNEIGNRKLGSSANEYDTCTTATVSSPEPEEYTYEGAIENYKSRISRTHSSDLLSLKLNGKNNIIEKSSDSSNEIISFEKENSLNNNDDHLLKSSKDSAKLLNSKSIKDRLSLLEKVIEDNSAVHKSNYILPDSKVNNVKVQLNNLEEYSNDNEKTNCNITNDELTALSIKDRLAALNNRNAPEKSISSVSTCTASKTIQDRLANLDSSYNKEFIKQTKVEHEESTFISCIDELRNNDMIDLYNNKIVSLENLNTGACTTTIEKCEKIPSINILLKPETDTDREDSGIQTADVSCVVSQDDSNSFLFPACELYTNSQSVSGDLIESVSCDDESSIKTSNFESTSHVPIDKNEFISQKDNSEELITKEKDTVKSLDADVSVSFNDNSVTSECENIVFEGKMLIHVNFKEIQSLIKNNSDLESKIGNDTNPSEIKTMLSCDRVMVSEISTNIPLSPTKVSLKSKPLSFHKTDKEIKNSNIKQIDNSTLTSNKFNQSLPILETSGRWNILQINNKIQKSPTLQNPSLNMPDVIPIHLDKEISEIPQPHEENFVFQITNFVNDNSIISHI